MLTIDGFYFVFTSLFNSAHSKEVTHCLGSSIHSLAPFLSLKREDVPLVDAHWCVLSIQCEHMKGDSRSDS